MPADRLGCGLRASLRPHRSHTGYEAKMAADVTCVVSDGRSWLNESTPELSIQSRPESARHSSQIQRVQRRFR